MFNMGHRLIAIGWGVGAGWGKIDQGYLHIYEAVPVERGGKLIAPILNIRTLLSPTFTSICLSLFISVAEKELLLVIKSNGSTFTPLCL
jgi:hypothetical protein